MSRIVTGVFLAGVLLMPRVLRADDWQPPTPVEASIFVAAELLIVVDAWQTVGFLNRPLPPGVSYQNEGNPLLGSHPSTGLILGAAAAAMLGVAAGWYFLPTPWRDCVTLPVVFVEVPVVTRNFSVGATLRF